MNVRNLVIFLTILSISISNIEAKTEKAAHYKKGQSVPFYANKIGPYSNPSESYEFYDKIRMCPPEGPKGHVHEHVSLGEDLIGDVRLPSAYDIHFKESTQLKQLCQLSLETYDIQQYKEAINQYYHFELVYDGIPLYGFIGSVIPETTNGVTKNRYFFFSHLHFHMLYNGDQVIHGNITADYSRMTELLDTSMIIKVTYSVEWSPTEFKYKDRMKFPDYLQKKNLQIHWLSIMNSIVLVLLLTGFLAIIILRILKNDYSRYALIEDDEEGGEQEDYGWKLVHGDVFRFPPNKTLFCALVGLGVQFLTILFAILFLAIIGLFYPGNGGTLYVAAIVLYALTSVLGGFVSASFYRQFGGENWAWNIVLVGTLYTIPSVLVFSYVNTVAIIYSATAAVPVSAILIILAILILVGFPLNVIGGIAGRRSASSFEVPCRTKNFPREIPPIAWYRSLPFQMAMAGFLPFSAIYTELRYVFESAWGHKSYQLFGILLLVAVILIIVTACITVALTYFQLSMEDYRWWWHSFLNGGSTGLFIYAYAIFYFNYSTMMTGALQSSFYFSYMLLVCLFFFVMLGTVGFYASLIFVKRIYRGLKID
eukprot:TRINITY_DN9402_c0_g1_i1.p1 TRINITY_DN9402_c0_g1~~TRINITY_DN9402_c0_g1_i1.p1  ORF type:complete len:595 (-),score=198.20 TRINITY_DN9402_c0_g1_i1:66-1850(-)